MNTIELHTLGYPGTSARSALSSTVDAYSRGQLDAVALEASGRQLRARRWAEQAGAGLHMVSVGDFAFCDRVTNHIGLFGCEPERFGFDGSESQLKRQFEMAGGPHALETARWFDTGDDYVVPEFSASTTFSLNADRLLAELDEAQALGHTAKVTLIGPLTFLWLGKGADAGWDRLSLLDQLLPAYGALLVQLKDRGTQWVQMDEPILGLDLPSAWRNAFGPCYWRLCQAGARLMLATYYSPLAANISLACRLPVAGLHVDGMSAPHELTSVCDWLPVPKVLSVGIVDAGSVDRTDLDAALGMLRPLLERRGELWLAPSSPLAVGPDKLAELATLKAALHHGAEAAPGPGRKRAQAVPVAA